MEDYKSTYPSDEKLTASTSILVRNNTDEFVSIENWTCGFVFRVDTANCAPHTEARLKAEYVWYDFRAKNANNEIIASIKGVYYNKIVALTKDPKGTYSLVVEKK